jgi:hypothetical protein
MPSIIRPCCLVFLLWTMATTLLAAEPATKTDDKFYINLASSKDIRQAVKFAVDRFEIENEKIVRQDPLAPQGMLQAVSLGTTKIKVFGNGTMATVTVVVVPRVVVWAEGFQKSLRFLKKSLGMAACDDEKVAKVKAPADANQTFELIGIKAGKTRLKLTDDSGATEEIDLVVLAPTGTVRLAVGEAKRLSMKEMPLISDVSTFRANIVQVLPVVNDQRVILIEGLTAGTTPINLTAVDGKSELLMIEVTPKK